jgi:hypothetical protein
MTEAVLTKDRVIDSGTAVSQPQLSDTTRMAENALLQALEFCVQEIGLDGPQAIARQIQQGNTVVCVYFRYGLAKQVAQSMGALDGNIKAVYTLDCSIVPVDLSSGELTQDTQRIHLLVWMQPEKLGFGSLVEALDRALVQAYADILGVDDLVTLLDVKVMDDADVEKLIGYGAVLASICHRVIAF